MEIISLKNLTIDNHRIEYEFQCPKRFIKYLKSDECKIILEYPNCDLSKIPQGVLMVPFVGNILIVSMLMDISIEVPVLDKTFYESLPQIKRAFQKMYSYLNFNFNVKVDKLEDCRYDISPNKSLFFTGGLDATSALINTYKEKPILINIWGGDTNTKDLDSHNHLENYLKQITSALDLQYQFIKSNCREMYNEPKVSKFLATRIAPWNNHGWWASIAHILSMTTLLAPLVYEKRIGTHYIGSSYTKSSNTFDANNNILLESIKFSSCNLKGVDGDLTRIDKAKKIIEFSKKNEVPLELNVCWYKTKGQNCSHCEKCYRTILELIVNRGDPNQFGFTINDQTYEDICLFLKNNYVNKEFWKSIINTFKIDKEYWQMNPQIKWILNVNINSPRVLLRKIYFTTKRMLSVK